MGVLLRIPSRMVFKLSFAALILVPLIIGQPIDGECCTEKIVGPYEYVLAGDYRGNVPRQCINTCVYTRVDNGRLYCFQPGEKHVECEDEGPTPSADGCVCAGNTILGTEIIAVKDRSTAQTQCVGILVASSIVMVPGSCTEGFTEPDIYAILGVLVPSIDIITVDVELILQHQNLSRVSFLKLVEHVDISVYPPLCYTPPPPAPPLSKQGVMNVTAIIEMEKENYCNSIKAGFQYNDLASVPDEAVADICASLIEILDFEANLLCQLSLGPPPPPQGLSKLKQGLPPCVQQGMLEGMMLTAWQDDIIQASNSTVCLAPPLPPPMG